MHEDGTDMAELEAQLYAQVHHDSSATAREVPQYNPAPVRLVSDRNVINTTIAGANRAGNRYWQYLAPSSNTRPQTNKNPSNRPQPNLTVTSNPIGQPKFVPYQSFLSGMRTPQQQKAPAVVVEKSREKSPKKSKKQPKQKFINPMNQQNLSKLDRISKYQEKKEKAESAKASSKKSSSPRRKVSSETIVLIDSSDEDDNHGKLVDDGNVEVKANLSETTSEPSKLEDEDDEVIMIPIPPPPLVTIDDSSDESVPPTVMQSPAKKKKKTNKKKTKKMSSFADPFKPSSRCVSPSNSSIMSDDFIGGNDRDLLRNLDSLQEFHDVELQNSEMTVEQLLRLRKMGKSPGVAKVLEITNRNVSKGGLFLQPSDKNRNKDSSAATISGIRQQTTAVRQPTSSSESDTETSGDLTSTSNVIKTLLSSDSAEIVPKKKRKNSKQDDTADDSIYERLGGSKKKKQVAVNVSSDSESDADIIDVYEDTDFNRVPYLVRPEDEQNYVEAFRKRKEPSPYDKNYHETDSFIAKLNNICDENFEDDEGNGDQGALAQRNRNDNDSAILDEIQEVLDVSSAEDVDMVASSDEPLEVDGNEPNAETILNTKYINPLAYRHEYFRGKKVMPPRDTFCADEIDIGLRNDTKAGSTDKVAHEREIGWNEEMRRFYYGSWGSEDFNVRQLLRSQTNNNHAWHITKTDKFPYVPHNRHIRCHNCQEIGHIAAKCRAPTKKCVCHMCGEDGHREPRCPNTICLRCGSPARVYGYGCVRCRNEESMTCALCRVKGHSINYCPDKWRRYYSTTVDNNVVVNDVVYNSVKTYCSVCAGRGHRSNECRSSSKVWLQKMYLNEIQSHTPIYPKKFANDEETLNRKAKKMAYAMFTMATGEFSFNYNINMTSDPDSLYNRFKRAVNLKDVVPIETREERRERKRKEKALINYGQAKETIRSILHDYSFSEEMRKLEQEKDKFELSFITDGVDLDISNKSISPEVVKAPATMVEKVGKKDEITQTSPAVPIKSSPPGPDEDSSYNFLEYFPKGDENVENPVKKVVDELSTLVASNEPPPPGTTEVMAALDFIPLSAGDENERENDDIQLTNVVVGASQISNLTNPTEAKIFLSKLHCKILLSLDGNNYLNAASTKHELVFRFVWQSFGNMLLITGTRDRQDQFHTELIDYLKQKEDETYTHQIETSTRVPKQRTKLMRFLKENINSLERNSGNNVQACYSKLQFFEESGNRAHSDRMRRQLNMMLMGQIGLCDGKFHLAALKTQLVDLQKDKITNIVSDEFRNQVQSHYNYIFTSYNHKNYEDLIEHYQQLRTQMQPRASTSSMSVKTNVARTSTPHKAKPTVVEKEIAIEPVFKSKTQLPALPVTLPTQNTAILTEADEPQLENSTFWSGKCMHIIQECRDILNTLKNNKGIAKLEVVSLKAKNEQLTFNDYSSLVKILSKIKKNNE